MPDIDTYTTDYYESMVVRLVNALMSMGSSTVSIHEVMAHYRETCGCEYCLAVEESGSRSLRGQMTWCGFCRVRNFRFREGGHDTESCPSSYECPGCRHRHEIDAPPCIYCPNCFTTHPEPRCCEAPYSSTDNVPCIQCGGWHTAPSCHDTERFRNCRNRNQDGERCIICCTMLNAYDERRASMEDIFPINDDDDSHVGCDCEMCLDTRQHQISRFHMWNYQPPLLMRGEGPLWLGMEVELEINDQRTDRETVLETAAAEFGEFVYFKSDGSLEYGFEMVSHPATYQWWIENFNWQGLRTLSNSGCRTTVGTGIHIHVNRAALTSPSHSFRWLKFWYRNAFEIQTLARRTGSHWAAFSRSERRAAKYFCKPLTRNGQVRYRDENGENVFAERYSAVNVTNAATYEIRVFRASMSIRRVQSFLALADASVRYTQQLTVPAIRNGGWEFPAFREWVDQQDDLYRPLGREMEACL